MLTGDSLFVGDTARPDLAVGATEGAEGLFHSLRRLLELSDGVEVFPGHVAGSLCGKAMSSKPSTTIGFERRFNPMLSHRRARRVHRRVGRDRRAEAAEPRPHRRAQPRARSSARRRSSRSSPRRPPARSSSTCARVAASPRTGTSTGAINVPVSGSSFATKAGFVLDAGRARVRARGDRRRRRERAIRGLHSVASSTSRATSLGGGDERTGSVTVDELEELDRRRRRGDRRPREGRARHRLHPRQPQHPLPAARHLRRRPPHRPADRHDLRERRREPRSPRASSSPGATTPGPSWTAA